MVAADGPEASTGPPARNARAVSYAKQLKGHMLGRACESPALRFAARGSECGCGWVYFGVTSTVQPLPRASVIVPPLAELPVAELPLMADEPLAPDALDPEPLLVEGVVPVVEGDEEDALLLLGEDVVDEPPVLLLLLGDDVLAVAPDGLRSAVIISVMPGSTMKVRASAEALDEPMAPLEPLAPDVLEPVALRVPDAVEPLEPEELPSALEPDAPELPVVLEPLRPDVDEDEPSAPVIMMRQGAIALEDEDVDEDVAAPEAPGELLLLLCATATAVNMDVDRAANATDDRILRILLSSADLGRNANSRQRIRIARVPVCARLHSRAPWACADEGEMRSRAMAGFDASPHRNGPAASPRAGTSRACEARPAPRAPHRSHRG